VSAADIGTELDFAIASEPSLGTEVLIVVEKDESSGGAEFVGWICPKRGTEVGVAQEGGSTFALATLTRLEAETGGGEPGNGTGWSEFISREKCVSNEDGPIWERVGPSGGGVEEPSGGSQVR
jgi:hypothetical protein